MSFFSKKDKKAPEQGYVSFNQDDLSEAKSRNLDNTEAYDYLDAALTTSSHISAKDKNGNTVDIDDVYPCSAEECDEMEKLLDKAEQAVKDPNDQFFKERLAELREIVSWSRKKHWTFRWILIVGCLISIFLLNWCSDDAKDDQMRAQQAYDQVDNWAEQDTTITWEGASEIAMYEYSTANAFKSSYLNAIKYDFNLSKERIDQLAWGIDTCTTDKSRERLKAQHEKEVQHSKDLRKKFDEAAGMKFKELKKIAIAQKQGRLDATKSSSRSIQFYLILCIILIPLYIWSSYQPGYYITRHRTENKVLGGIQKVGFAIASAVFGAGIAMALMPDTEVTTHYSDGSTTKHTESNTGNFIIIALKFLLMIAGVLIFCFVSLFIMAYVTATAMKRNIAWGAMAKKAAAATIEATSKAKDAINKNKQ
ncbi:MAG: hypothetical protein KBT20_10565 [Bacteroidales bacterium]|nr:hypothetical protein [Candidatus Liminaster caballi]